jgi:uncharacterized protein (DUF433 family)
VLLGKPVIRGTRISVEHVIGLLAEGASVDEILRNYPHLTADDVAACLRYAHRLVRAERAHSTAA